MTTLQSHGFVLWGVPRFHRQIEPLPPARNAPKTPEPQPAPLNANNSVMPANAALSSSEPAAA